MARRSFTQVPYAYGDGKFGTAIGQTRNGVEELVQLVGLMEYDPVSGLWAPPGVHANPARFRVDAQISGRNVQPQIVQISSTPLGAGASQEFATLDISAAPGVAALGYMLYTDLPTALHVAFDDALHGFSISAYPHLRLCLVRNLPFDASDRGPALVPAFPVLGKRRRLWVKNLTATAQTVFDLYELRYSYVPQKPQNTFTILVYDLAIRDTNIHDWNSDQSNIFVAIRILLGGGKLPIYVVNGLNQAVNVTVVLAGRIGGAFGLGTKNFAAGQSGIITNADFAGIDVPSEQVAVKAQCTTAPTSGTLNVYADLLVGGV